MTFDFGFQDAESACTRCHRGRLRYRISSTGPWILNHDKATCPSCNCEAQLWLDDHGDGTATVIPLVPGVDYDSLLYKTLVGLHRAATARRAGGDASSDLRQQIADLDAAIKRRSWEIMGSVDGQERSLGRWQTRERCEEHVRKYFVPEGDHEVSPGRVRHFSYRYVEHT